MKPAPDARLRSLKYATVALCCAALVLASLLFYHQQLGGAFLTGSTSSSRALRQRWRGMVERKGGFGLPLAFGFGGGGSGGDGDGAAGEDTDDFVPVAGAQQPAADGGDGAGGAAVGAQQPPPAAAAADDLPEYLRDTAVVTLAAGDDSGRLAVALVQSLRDSGTRVPHIVVMLARGGKGSDDCTSADSRRSRGRERVDCNGPDTVAEEIVSGRYLDALRALGAETVVVDTIPETPFTNKVPGGRTVFWGMAMQKLHVFNMTRFRKLLWMDSDTMVLRNMDHLLREPMFTAAYTHACCNPNAPAVPSGGLWVVEPSKAVGEGLWRAMNLPLPGSKEGDDDYARLYMYGDMQLVRYYFSNLTWRAPNQPLWPFAEDSSTGVVPNLRVLPAYANATPAEMTAAATWRHGGPLQGQVLGEGLRPEWAPQLGARPYWHVLDPRYDQCVGMCECLPGRDIPDQYFSVHFSCLHGFRKPSEYASEAELGEALYYTAVSCQRHYFWTWYGFFKRGFGRLPPPYWEGPAIPGYNATHDALVTAWRLAKKNR
jgi:hypothetical protein